jgi:AraC-like DNA-binding protein
VTPPEPYVVTPKRGAVRHSANEATLRVASFSHIPEVLRSLGADPADVCAAAGFDATLFNDPDSLTTYRAASHLFRVCTEQTRCPHFGLLNGQKNGLHTLGFVGLLVKYSPDVRTALRTLVRYVHLHIRGAVASLEDDDKVATFGYEIYALGAEATDQIADSALCTMFNTVVALCGRHFKPIEVRFEHRRPADLAPFHRFYQAPLRFGMNENALVFAASWLNRPLPAVEPELGRLLRERMEALEAQYQDDFPDQVRSILRTALLADHGSADQVAKLLCMHSRTLHRRLAASGTNFRTVVDECRYEIARQMLEDSDCDVGQIAYMLDYADTSAFARAFRRWSGTPPSRWRTRDAADVALGKGPPQSRVAALSTVGKHL